jgi:glycosyltransferase involved in cell wall biosynthesis
MKTKRISVCIATYNGEKYVYSQLQSILEQLNDNDEVIVSDDNSEDRTVEIIRSFNDGRINIYKNLSEKGYTSNFENALKYARGKFIFLSDQDDIWQKRKVERCLYFLQKYDLVVSDAAIINENNETISPSFFSLRNPYKTLLGNILKFGYLGCCLAFTDSVLNKSLPFPPKREYCTHDNWLFLVALSFCNVKIVDEKLIFYRRHSLNVSTGGIFNRTSFIFKIKYRFYLLFYMLKRGLRK